MLKHIAVICLCMGMIVSCQAQEPVKKPDIPKLQSSDAGFPPDAAMRYDERSGCIFRLEGKNLSENLENDKSFQGLQSENRFADIAIAFIAAHHSAFRLLRPSEELKVSSFNVEGSGQKHIRLSQLFEGIPVRAAEIIVHLNRSNQVYLVEGRYIPTPSGLSIRPLITDKEALRKTADDLKQADCPGCRHELVIFSDTSAKPYLAYRVIVKPAQGWEYFIDAQTGNILAKLSINPSPGPSPKRRGEF